MGSTYKSKRWRDKTKLIKRRDNFECQECARYGRKTDAKLVHHIFPTDLYPELFFNNDNLVSLCFKCHELMHNRSTGEVTALGLDWQKRRKLKIQKNKNLKF